ncbi:MAG: aminoacyl-histidine dipeptidase [Alkalispirochaeta sp.]
MNTTTPNEAIAGLEPEAVWRHFSAISAIPRCSKKEQSVRQYVLDQAKRLGLEAQTDGVGNAVIRRPGVGSGADHATVTIQGHLDMVCEKNMGVDHDFDTDPISLVREGDWLTADRTTLGADNGIAVAMMLALLESDLSPLPPLECIFTVDEETGLTGALQIDPEIVTGRTMINLDTEEEGFFCIGCAGGKNTYGTLPLVWESTDASGALQAISVQLTGLRGGHSGVNIHEERGNSVVLGARLTDRLLQTVPSLRIADIRGGDKHNAIPREFEVVVVVPADATDTVRSTAAAVAEEFAAEFGDRELNLSVSTSPTDLPERVIGASGARSIVDLLLALPHGVLGMSHDVPGLVETSSNLAAVRIEEGNASFLTSQRSSRGSLIEWASTKITAAIRLAGGTPRAAEAYPAWPPRTDSPLLTTAVAAYKRLYDAEPEVGAFHAGLECGVINDKVGGMDMISFGPDMDGVHTPDERVSISSTERTWNLLLEIVRAL